MAFDATESNELDNKIMEKVGKVRTHKHLCHEHESESFLEMTKGRVFLRLKTITANVHEYNHPETV